MGIALLFFGPLGPFPSSSDQKEGLCFWGFSACTTTVQCSSTDRALLRGMVGRTRKRGGGLETGFLHTLAHKGPFSSPLALEAGLFSEFLPSHPLCSSALELSILRAELEHKGGDRKHPYSGWYFQCGSLPHWTATLHIQNHRQSPGVLVSAGERLSWAVWSWPTSGVPHAGFIMGKETWQVCILAKSLWQPWVEWDRRKKGQWGGCYSCQESDNTAVKQQWETDGFKKRKQNGQNLMPD